VHADDVAEHVLHAAQGLYGPGVMQLAGAQWSPRDTVDVMDVKVNWSSEPFGWRGDVAVSASPTCFRSIESGVREALESLGWSK
jgi:hypothetical protein